MQRALSGKSKSNNSGYPFTPLGTVGIPPFCKQDSRGGPGSRRATNSNGMAAFLARTAATASTNPPRVLQINGKSTRKHSGEGWFRGFLAEGEPTSPPERPRIMKPVKASNRGPRRSTLCPYFSFGHRSDTVRATTLPVLAESCVDSQLVTLIFPSTILVPNLIVMPDAPAAGVLSVGYTSA